ncbi:MAG TPA: acyl-CoA thioesterase [Vicinamibacteria bacterium]|nr:acyl-CoA thioesterase [Vicinamibacteria bacterium]
MLGQVHDYELLIHEQHLDTFGHVNNATYLEILEEARWDLITANGYGLDEVHRRRIGPVVLDVQLRFRRELRNRQRVTIRSWLESHSGKIGRFEQHILDDAGNLCCEAVFTIGLFDLTARKLISPTPEWIAALGLRPEDLGESG